jgi:hypothetical protein
MLFELTATRHSTKLQPLAPAGIAKGSLAHWREAEKPSSLPASEETLMSIYRLSIALLLVSPLLSPFAWAQTPAPEKPQTLEQAIAQEQRASAMRKAAAEQHLDDQAACYKLFQVSSCLDKAKKRYTQAIIDARNVEIPAREFQREAKRADVEAKEAQRAADAPRREAEQKDQAATFRANEALKAAEREKKIADKTRQAAEGRQKTASEQAERKARDQERAENDAKRAARKASAEAKADAEAAASVPKP